jgi:hypothetical protein
MKKKPTTIISAMEDPNLFGPWFQGESWTRWKVFLKTLFGLALTSADIEIYQKHTQRESLEDDGYKEAWLIVGRRGGNSLISALTAVYLACFRDWSQYLQRGEFGTICVIASDRRQGRVILRYIRAFLEIPLLKRLIRRDTDQKSDQIIELVNNIVIEIHTCSFRALRGYTLLCCIADEIAFWRSDETSANPDKEVITAVRGGLSNPGFTGMLLCISSPYSRKGMLWEMFKRHFGEDHSKVMVWHGESLDMNPLLPPQVVLQALQEDEHAARAEYLPNFVRISKASLMSSMFGVW